MTHEGNYGKKKELQIDGAKITVYRTEQYERIPVRETEEFALGTMRTVDMGQPGYSKLIRVRLKTTGKWATATYLISHQISEKTKNKLRRAAIEEIKRKSKW